MGEKTAGAFGLWIAWLLEGKEDFNMVKGGRWTESHV